MRLNTLLSLLTFSTALTTVDGLFEGIVSRFCGTIVSALPVPDACKCSGGWALSTGWNFNLNCSLDKPLCVPDVTDVCGTASFKGKYYRREHKAPLSIRNPINLNNCTARYDIKPCASCEICNNGTGFEVDCSNIEVIKVLGSPVYLPKTEGCIGIPKG